jgi:hypoxanthine-DNA glycosylase
MACPLATLWPARPIALAAAGEEQGEKGDGGEFEEAGHWPSYRHCEPQAKQSMAPSLDCFATLAMTRMNFGLPPIAAPDARLLILGSLPGEASLQAERYYAHPRNHFWRLVGEVVGEPLDSLGYDERLAALKRHRIALWDVIASARREGSLDQSLRDVEARDLPAFVASLPELRAVGFNGATAARIGRKALGATNFTLFDLPSSSPAFTLPIAAKAERWSVLKPLLVD